MALSRFDGTSGRQLQPRVKIERGKSRSASSCSSLPITSQLVVSQVICDALATARNVSRKRSATAPISKVSVEVGRWRCSQRFQIVAESRSVALEHAVR